MLQLFTLITIIVIYNLVPLGTTTLCREFDEISIILDILLIIETSEVQLYGLAINTTVTGLNRPRRNEWCSLSQADREREREIRHSV